MTHDTASERISIIRQLDPDFTVRDRGGVQRTVTSLVFKDAKTNTTCPIIGEGSTPEDAIDDWWFKVVDTRQMWQSLLRLDGTSFVFNPIHDCWDQSDPVYDDFCRELEERQLINDRSFDKAVRSPEHQARIEKRYREAVAPLEADLRKIREQGAQERRCARSSLSPRMQGFLIGGLMAIVSGTISGFRRHRRIERWW